MAMRTTLEVIISLDGTIDKLEKAILKAVRPREEWRQLKTIWGVGNILAMTIYLESGPIDRFASPGRYTSYSRLVPSKRMSNGKKKGVGNQKCGNRYLCWAWVEAANFAIRSYPIANRFYHRKTAKTLPVVGRKALAHKLARAGWHVMRTGEPFNPNRVFS